MGPWPPWMPDPLVFGNTTTLAFVFIGDPHLVVAHARVKAKEYTLIRHAHLFVIEHNVCEHPIGTSVLWSKDDWVQRHLIGSHRH